MAALGNGVIIPASRKAIPARNSRVLHGTDTVIPDDREERTGAHSGTGTGTHRQHLVIPLPQIDSSPRHILPCIRERFKHATYYPVDQP